jgi:hypothetical protein
MEAMATPLLFLADSPGNVTKLLNHDEDQSSKRVQLAEGP